MTRAILAAVLAAMPCREQPYRRPPWAPAVVTA